MVYKTNFYNGMMCKFVCELKKKRRKGALEEIAAGGRYDRMLNDLRYVLINYPISSIVSNV